MLLTAALVASLSALPESVPFPPGVTVDAATLSEHTWDEVNVYVGTTKKSVRGATWSTWFEFGDGQSHPMKETLGQWRPLLEGKGWKLTGSDEGGWHSFSRKDGKDEWALSLGLGDYDRPHLFVVKAGGAPRKLVATAPSKSASSVKDGEDWPFVPKLDGWQRTGSGLVELAFVMKAGDEQHFIADASTRKDYAHLKSLSRLEFVHAYGDAFRAAGWVVPVQDEAEGVVWAHYVKDGKDVWVCGTNAADGTDRSIGFAVVDKGNELEKGLDAADCKVALRGVTFEFNKSTLRKDSDAQLLAVADALKRRAKLKLEVAGHTDNVGDDAYNQKLSEARATAVKAWLAAHGVAAERLTAKGYGKGAPVASNDSDEGRAKNRRVELVCAK